MLGDVVIAPAVAARNNPADPEARAPAAARPRRSCTCSATTTRTTRRRPRCGRARSDTAGCGRHDPDRLALDRSWSSSRSSWSGSSPPPRSPSRGRTACAPCRLREDGRRGSIPLAKIVENPAPYLERRPVPHAAVHDRGLDDRDLVRGPPFRQRGRDRRDDRDDAAAVHLRGGDAQDLRDRAHRQRRAGDRAGRSVPGTVSGRSRTRCSCFANVLMPGKGLKEGPYITEQELRAMRRGRLRRGRDRGGGEGADPLHLRVRRHDRARGHGATPRHRGRRGHAVAPRRAGAGARARLLADPRVPRGSRRRRRGRVREGRPEGAASGQDDMPLADIVRPGALRAGVEEGRGPAAGDAAGEVPPGDRHRRVRVGHRDRLARGPARGAGRRDHRRVRRRGARDGRGRRRRLPGVGQDLDRRRERACSVPSSPTRSGTRSAGSSSTSSARSPTRARRPSSRACGSAPRRSRAAGSPPCVITTASAGPEVVVEDDVTGRWMTRAIDALVEPAREAMGAGVRPVLGLRGRRGVARERSDLHRPEHRERELPGLGLRRAQRRRGDARRRANDGSTRSRS